MLEEEHSISFQILNGQENCALHLQRLTTELKVLLQDYASKGRNARGEPRPVAAATQERRLLGVAALLRDVGLGTSIALPEPHEPHQTRTK